MGTCTLEGRSVPRTLKTASRSAPRTLSIPPRASEGVVHAPWNPTFQQEKQDCGKDIALFLDVIASRRHRYVIFHSEIEKAWLTTQCSIL